MDVEQIDPRLREAVRKLPSTDPNSAVMRLVGRLATRVMPVPKTAGVAVTTVRIGGRRARVYRPDESRTNAALVWIHGGGLLFGDARQDEPLCAGTSAELGITVVSVNYRFAPEHPYPAALDDVHDGWRWLRANAAALGVDPDRVVVGGESAGGGLAAALVLRLHDEGRAQPIGQWLFSPMIDDRTAADTALDAVEHAVWPNTANRVGWTGYLGAAPGGPAVPAYASAARRTDLGGLPPAYIAVGDIELFHDEDADYAGRLAAAGVPTVLDVVAGAPHGFENWARQTEPARDLLTRARAWLADLVAETH